MQRRAKQDKLTERFFLLKIMQNISIKVGYNRAFVSTTSGSKFANGPIPPFIFNDTK